MANRAWSMAVAAVIGGGLAVVTSVSLVGQRPAGGPETSAGAANLPGADAVKAFVAARTAKDFKPPRTPWGDPDIQGVFTTKDEANTPLARPAEWAGRKMSDITADEFATAVANRQQAAVESAPFAGGGEEDSGVAIAVPIHWFDNLAAMNSRPWFVIEPEDGQVPPLTVEAAARQGRPRGQLGGNRDHYTDRNLNDRCIAMTWRQPGLYGNSYQILQTAGYVVLRREQIHEARIIPLDGRPHVGPSVRSYEGDGRGRWEGNTLVVEFTNFNTNVPFRAGVRRGDLTPSPDLRVVERFTRTAPNKVEWSVTMDDPGSWTRPWTYSMPLTQDDAQLIHEYACHEGNFGLANILSAGRAAEKKSAGRAAAKK